MNAKRNLPRSTRLAKPPRRLLLKSAKRTYERALDLHQHGRFEQAATQYAASIMPFIRESAFELAVEAFRRLTSVETRPQVVNFFGDELLAAVGDAQREVVLVALLAFHARHRRDDDWKAIAKSLGPEDTNIARLAIDDVATRAATALQHEELCATQLLLDLGRSLEQPNDALAKVEADFQSLLADAPDAFDFEEVDLSMFETVSESLLEPIDDEDPVFESPEEIDEPVDAAPEVSEVIELEQAVPSPSGFEKGGRESTRNHAIPMFQEPEVPMADDWSSDEFPELEPYQIVGTTGSNRGASEDTRRHGLLLHGMNAYRNLRSILRLASRAEAPAVMVFEDGDRRARAAFPLVEGGFVANGSLRGLVDALWTVADMATTQAFCIHFSSNIQFGDASEDGVFDQRQILGASADYLGATLRDRPAARLYAQIVDMSDEAWLILEDPDDESRHILASRNAIDDEREELERALSALEVLSLEVTSLCGNEERVVSTNLLVNGAVWSFVRDREVQCLIRTSGPASVSALGHAAAYCWSPSEASSPS